MINKSAGVRNVLARRYWSPAPFNMRRAKYISDSSTFVYHAVALLLHILLS